MAKTYTAKQGDNWWEVAKKNWQFQSGNPSPQELTQAASILSSYNSNVKSLLPGMTVKIPNSSALPPDDRSLSQGENIRMKNQPLVNDIRSRMSQQQSSWNATPASSSYNSYIPSFSVNQGSTPNQTFMPSVSSNYGSTPAEPGSVTSPGAFSNRAAYAGISGYNNPNASYWNTQWESYKKQVDAGNANAKMPGFYAGSMSEPGAQGLLSRGYKYMNGASGWGYYAGGKDVKSTSTELDKYYQQANWRINPNQNSKEQKRASGGYSGGFGGGGNLQAVAAITDYDQSKYGKYDPYTGKYFYDPTQTQGQKYGNVATNVMPIYSQTDGKYYLMHRQGQGWVTLTDEAGNKIEYTDAINLAANAGSGDAPQTAYASTGYLNGSGGSGSGSYYTTTGRRVTNPGFGSNVSMRW